MKTVRQILGAKGHTVLTIGPDATVYEALQELAAHDVGALVVTEEGEVVGLFSERDYARKLVLLGRPSKETPVREIMTKEVICVGSKQTVDGCMALMTEKKVRHLPVLENEQLAGIISMRDVVKATIEDREATIEQLEHYIKGTR
ncbi:MAG: CBS domain-containing protein [Deltaproteobacteria bacterium]|nr:CBS domain-containing protein [Deltaproteobacteria bacterium]